MFANRSGAGGAADSTPRRASDVRWGVRTKILAVALVAIAVAGVVGTEVIDQINECQTTIASAVESGASRTEPAAHPSGAAIRAGRQAARRRGNGMLCRRVRLATIV
jgi:hypothetical protein